ncbi:MAG: alpha/beta hydrolase, partial [Flavobacteriaceae bacterium]|nr:alpha/beta hydrolase [Flavobacteriaceae bacterium]
MKKILILVLLFSIGVTPAQKETYKSEVINVTNLVEGSLLLPDTVKPPLVILIPGSGPT